MVLIPGAGGRGWVWHLVEADLRRRGYDAFAVDLPADDESKGLPGYADAVVSATRERAAGDAPCRWNDVNAASTPYGPLRMGSE